MWGVAAVSALGGGQAGVLCGKVVWAQSIIYLGDIHLLSIIYGSPATYSLGLTCSREVVKPLPLLSLALASVKC